MFETLGRFFLYLSFEDLGLICFYYRLLAHCSNVNGQYIVAIICIHCSGFFHLYLFGIELLSWVSQLIYSSNDISHFQSQPARREVWSSLSHLFHLVLMNCSITSSSQNVSMNLQAIHEPTSIFLKLGIVSVDFFIKLFVVIVSRYIQR